MQDAEPGRFYDGGSLDGSVPPRPGTEPLIVLERRLSPKRPALLRFGRARRHETFLLRRRIAYDARWHGGRTLRIVVPAPTPADTPDEERFRTDLTSVPDLFTWLIPRTGPHLPAALVHDGLIHDPEEPASYEAAEAVPRIDADRIFREAMADLGTSPVRSWLMWTAVTLATVIAGINQVPAPGGAGVPAAEPGRGGAGWNNYYRVVVLGTLALILALGTLATLDLFDVWDVLPWMGRRSTVAELVLGGVFAVLVPAALSVLWLRLWPAGVITGVALALLLHVTVVLALLTSVFQLVDWLLRPRRTP